MVRRSTESIPSMRFNIDRLRSRSFRRPWPWRIANTQRIEQAKRKIAPTPMNTSTISIFKLSPVDTVCRLLFEKQSFFKMFQNRNRISCNLLIKKLVRQPPQAQYAGRSCTLTMGHRPSGLGHTEVPDGKNSYFVLKKRRASRACQRFPRPYAREGKKQKARTQAAAGCQFSRKLAPSTLIRLTE
jgi:hypothetical protein